MPWKDEYTNIVEIAVLEYKNSKSLTEKNELYNTFLHKAYIDVVESFVHNNVKSSSYKFQNTLKRDLLIYLSENIVHYDPMEKHDKISFFNIYSYMFQILKKRFKDITDTLNTSGKFIFKTEYLHSKIDINRPEDFFICERANDLQ